MVAFLSVMFSAGPPSLYPPNARARRPRTTFSVAGGDPLLDEPPLGRVSREPMRLLEVPERGDRVTEPQLELAERGGVERIPRQPLLVPDGPERRQPGRRPLVLGKRHRSIESYDRRGRDPHEHVVEVDDLAPGGFAGVGRGRVQSRDASLDVIRAELVACRR